MEQERAKLVAVTEWEKHKYEMEKMEKQWKFEQQGAKIKPEKERRIMALRMRFL